MAHLFFQLNTKLYAGVGSSSSVIDILKKENCKHTLLLVDEGVFNNSPCWKKFLGLFEDGAFRTTVKTLRGSEEPDYDYLDSVAEEVRKLDDVDMFIGIGGGSSLDVSKALAVLKTNPGKGIEYRGFDKVKRAGVPIIAIPTTAGTGSEVTINAPIINKREKLKLGINGNYMQATYAILDPEWMLSLPTMVAVGSGLDAMVHAVESYVSPKGNEFTRMYAAEAVRHLVPNLSVLVEDGHNLEKRLQLLIGSYYAGISMFNSATGAAHVISYPLGTNFGVPHGLGGGMFLADVVAFNVEHGCRSYAGLMDAIEFHPDWDLDRKNWEFINRLFSLHKALGLPDTLAMWGITKDNLELVAALMKEVEGGFANNPVPFRPVEDTLTILRKHV